MLMAKIDIKSAFRLLPVDPTDHHLLTMKWCKQLYIDTCLPLPTSCLIFQQICCHGFWNRREYRRLCTIQMTSSPQALSESPTCLRNLASPQALLNPPLAYATQRLSRGYAITWEYHWHQRRWKDHRNHLPSQAQSWTLGTWRHAYHMRNCNEFMIMQPPGLSDIKLQRGRFFPGRSITNSASCCLFFYLSISFFGHGL